MAPDSDSRGTHGLDSALRFALSDHDVSSPLTPDEMRTLADETEEALIQSESQFSHPDWRYVDGLRALAGVPTLDPNTIDSQALRKIADSLERVDWPGGAVGQAIIDCAADYIDQLRAALAAAGAAGQRDRERLEWLFDEEATFTHDKETGEKYYRLHFDTGWCVDFRGAIDAARAAKEIGNA